MPTILNYSDTDLIMISYQNEVLVFFGDSRDSLVSIQTAYPHLRLKKIFQTHSDQVVEASDTVVEADAHYTAEINSALLIATADCMPIMVYCRQTRRVAAIHAGWRGIANRITEKTLQKLIASGSSNRDFRIWVGPHILQNSFEIDQEAYNLLVSAQYGLAENEFAYKLNSKYYVDLKKILFSQIQNAAPGTTDLLFLDIDTKTNSDYYSYRRDQKTKERNLSFICLLN